LYAESLAAEFIAQASSNGKKKSKKKSPAFKEHCSLNGKASRQLSIHFE